MESQNNEVAVVDIRMPFWSMVIFMVKLAIAAIPALIIVAVLWAMFAGFLVGFFGGLGG